MEQEYNDTYFDDEDYKDKKEKIEEAEENIEGQEIQQQQIGNDTYAEIADAEPDKKSLFDEFDEIRRDLDNTKTSNVDKELGPAIFNFPVRGAVGLKLAGDICKQKGWSHLFETIAQANLSTAMSKSGWFSELLISQHKQTKRSTSIGMTQQQKKTWTPWHKEKPIQPPQEVTE